MRLSPNRNEGLRRARASHTAAGAQIELHITAHDACKTSIDDDRHRPIRCFRVLGPHLSERIDPLGRHVVERQGAERRGECASLITLLQPNTEVRVQRELWGEVPVGR